MNRNGLLILAGVTLIAVVAVVGLLRPGDEAPAAGAGEPVLPGLAARINEIEAVDIVGPGPEVRVRLRRERGRWRVREKDDYEADFEIVREALRGLAEIRTVEARTANPDHYARLGVADMDHPEASGLRVEFPGEDLPALILGQIDPTGQGVYLRLQDDAQSWLADRPLSLPDTPLEWLERSVMDIPAEEIAAISILHPDGEVVELVRPAEGEMELANVPPGREPGAAWRRGAIANALARFRLEDVRRHREPVPADAVNVRFSTVDGLDFLARVFEDGEGRWVHFSVSVRSEEAESAQTEGEGAEAAPDNELLADAVAVDARLSPWDFGIREQRYDNLTRRLEDLLADPDSP